MQKFGLQPRCGQRWYIVRTFVVDIGRWEEVAEVQGEVFATIRPAATLLEVSALVSADLLVEIDTPELDQELAQGEGLAREGGREERRARGPEAGGPPVARSSERLKWKAARAPVCAYLAESFDELVE